MGCTCDTPTSSEYRKCGFCKRTDRKQTLVKKPKKRKKKQLSYTAKQISKAWSKFKSIVPLKYYLAVRKAIKDS